MPEFEPVTKKIDLGEGQLAAFEMRGTRLAVAQVDGEIYAISDICTHRGCSLSKGRLQETTVTCPCHGSQFDVTSGAVLRGPATKPVASYRTRIDNGMVLAEIG
jgi:3-phenylpropionate/trans-cinnamate dioxygenase ferredoxin subunit